MFIRPAIIAQRRITTQGQVLAPVNVQTINITNSSFLITWDNPSEDVVAPPTNVQTSNITNDSFLITWQ